MSKILGRNGGQECDTIEGHCSCGAYHYLAEAIRGQRKLTEAGWQELSETIKDWSK